MCRKVTRDPGAQPVANPPREDGHSRSGGLGVPAPRLSDFEPHLVDGVTKNHVPGQLDVAPAPTLTASRNKI
jgi:hypothetical protein